MTPVLFGLAPEEFFVTSGALDFVKPGPGPDPAVLRSGLASLEANRNRPYYEEAADAKAARALHRNDRPRSRRRPCSPR